MNKAPRCVQDTDATGLGVWLQKYKIISKNWNTLLYLHKKSSCYVVLTLVNIQAYTNKSARLVAFLKAYIRINFACWGILLQSCVCSWCGFMIRTSSNQRHSGTKALFSVPAQIHFLAYPDWFFKMWSAKNPQTHLMQFLHWFGNAIQIRFLQKCFSLDALATQMGFQSVFCVTRLSAQHNDDIKSRVTGVHQSGWADSMLLLAIWRTEDKSPWTDTEMNCLLHRRDERARFLMLFALKRRATIDVVTDANVATTAERLV